MAPVIEVTAANQRGGRRKAAVCALLTALALPTALLGGAGTSLAASAEGRCRAITGPYQREMEAYLGLEEDGRQTSAECRAIAAFQRENGVEMTDGYADVPTYRTMLVVAVRENPNAAGACPTRSSSVVCVDLTRQLMWVQEGEAGTVVYDAVPMRSGRRKLETRGGWHEIYLRKLDHYSTIYDDAPMPYSQFFSGGQAFHGTYENIFEYGSAGCVNLRVADARRLWHTVGIGDKVFVFGRKPGTSPRSIPAEPGAKGRSPLSDADLIAQGMDAPWSVRDVGDDTGA